MSGEMSNREAWVLTVQTAVLAAAQHTLNWREAATIVNLATAVPLSVVPADYGLAARQLVGCWVGYYWKKDEGKPPAAWIREAGESTARWWLWAGLCSRTWTRPSYPPIRCATFRLDKLAEW